MERPSFPTYSQLETALSAIFGNSQIKQKSPVGGGCINVNYKVTLEKGEVFFLKENEVRGLPHLFLNEARGLQALAVSGAPRIPQVLGVVSPPKGESPAAKQFLLLEYLESTSPSPSYWEDLGIGLAHLHLDNSHNGHNSRGKEAVTSFGFFENNYIGSTRQMNPWTEEWPVFFAQHRLEFQLKLARDKGLLSAADGQLAKKLLSKLDGRLPPPPAPQLLHGDLWSGNIHIDERGFPVILDPAVYYGHGEADLAMTELFGALPRSFYRAYESVSPLETGYGERKNIYNLYHLLNHLNLFGASYYRQCRAILERFA